MGWGSENAASAGSAASGASSASSAVGGAAGSSGSIYGSMADIGNTAGSEGATSAGFNVQPAASGMGPTAESANIQTYGTANPGTFDKFMNTYERFQKGGEQNIVQAWNKMGNNPETYGYAASKLSQFLKAGGSGQQMQPANLNISYQQPENSYLKKRGY